MDDQFISVGTAVITVSDTRSMETDASGAYAQATLEDMGHRVLHRRIIKDEVAAIRSEIEFCQQRQDIFIVILTGGTGITRRDVTPDAIRSMATKHIPGFGELFRMLSYSDIGSSTVQSRAEAWLCDTVLVFTLPGSTGAVKLAFEKILVEQLDARTRPCNFIRLRDRII
ncbi:MAG: molybdenum cofactor synthesis domain-containing protein [Myxococcota bacterium]|nr:molybdenum cofactor synthesis domain-containing protein [Myxococcota bacterium]